MSRDRGTGNILEGVWHLKLYSSFCSQPVHASTQGTWFEFTVKLLQHCVLGLASSYTAFPGFGFGALFFPSMAVKSLEEECRVTSWSPSAIPDLRRPCSCPGGPHPATSSGLPSHSHIRPGDPATNSGCSSSHLCYSLSCGHYQPNPSADSDPVFGDSSVPR